LEYLGVDGRMILKYILKKCFERAWTGLIWLKVGQVACCCEHGNEHLVPIKCGEYLDYLKKY
jgi:hypothetical protein